MMITEKTNIQRYDGGDHTLPSPPPSSLHLYLVVVVVVLSTFHFIFSFPTTEYKAFLSPPFVEKEYDGKKIEKERRKNFHLGDSSMSPKSKQILFWIFRSFVIFFLLFLYLSPVAIYTQASQ